MKQRKPVRPEDNFPPAILIKENVREMSRNISLSPCVKAPDHDDASIDYPRYAKEIAGVFTDSCLEWRAYSDTFRSRNGRPSQFQLAYSTPAFHSTHVTDDDCAKMGKAFRLINARLRSQREKYGYTEDFAELALRIASVFRAEYLAIDMALYCKAMHLTDRVERDRWEWVPLADARRVLDAIRDLDLPRCATCEKPMTGDEPMHVSRDYCSNACVPHEYSPSEEVPEGRRIFTSAPVD